MSRTSDMTSLIKIVRRALVGLLVSGILNGVTCQSPGHVKTPNSATEKGPNPKAPQAKTLESCSEYYQEIFVDSYPLAEGVVVAYDYHFQPEQHKWLKKEAFQLSVTLSLAYEDQMDSVVNFLDAIIFVPMDLNFDTAFEHQSQDTSNYKLEARFQGNTSGEIIRCSSPLRGNILISDTSRKQWEVSLVITNVPPRKRIEFYAIFFLDSSDSYIVRDVISLKSPREGLEDDLRETNPIQKFSKDRPDTARSPSDGNLSVTLPNFNSKHYIATLDKEEHGDHFLPEDVDSHMAGRRIKSQSAPSPQSALSPQSTQSDNPNFNYSTTKPRKPKKMRQARMRHAEHLERSFRKAQHRSVAALRRGHENSDSEPAEDPDYDDILPKVETQMRKITIKHTSNSPKQNTRVAPEYLPHVLPDFIVNLQLTYGGCGLTHSCFPFPANCHLSKNCFAFLSYRKEGDHLQVILMARTINWVAVGFSKDPHMGDDAVIVCRRVPNSRKASLWEGFNPGIPHSYIYGTSVKEGLKPHIYMVAGAAYDGVLTCSFELDMEYQVDAMDINFLTNKYFLLLAVGLDSDEPAGFGSITTHELAVASSKSISLVHTSKEIVQAGTHLAITFHEQLAVLTYGFLMPSAILMSRYGQYGFQYKAYRSCPTWLIVHAGFQVTSAICTVVNFILIYVLRSGTTFYSETSNYYHGVVGPAIFVMSFVNAVIGVLIHDFKSRNKPLPACLRWSHWIIGHLTLCFGAVELIRGPGIRKSWTSCSFSVIAAFNFLMYAGANVLLMFNTEHMRKKQDIPELAIRSFFGPCIRLKADGIPKASYSERRYIIIFTMCSLAISTCFMFLEMFLSQKSCTSNSLDYI